MSAIIGFDKSKVDVAKLQHAVDDVAGAIKPGITGLAAPFLGSMLDGVGTMVKAKISDWLDMLKIKFESMSPAEQSDFHLHVEEWDKFAKLQFAPDPSFATGYLANFPQTPVKCADYVKANPALVKKLQAKDWRGRDIFTQEQQAKILGNIDWLELLTTLAPIVFKILMALFL